MSNLESLNAPSPHKNIDPIFGDKWQFSPEEQAAQRRRVVEIAQGINYIFGGADLRIEKSNHEARSRRRKIVRALHHFFVGKWQDQKRDLNVRQVSKEGR